MATPATNPRPPPRLRDLATDERFRAIRSYLPQVEVLKVDLWPSRDRGLRPVAVLTSTAAETRVYLDQQGEHESLESLSIDCALPKPVAIAARAELKRIAEAYEIAAWAINARESTAAWIGRAASGLPATAEWALRTHRVLGGAFDTLATELELTATVAIDVAAPTSRQHARHQTLIRFIGTDGQEQLALPWTDMATALRQFVLPNEGSGTIGRLRMIGWARKLPLDVDALAVCVHALSAFVGQPESRRLALR